MVSSAAFPAGRIVLVVAAAVDAVVFPTVVTVASVAATLSGVVVTSMGVLLSGAEALYQDQDQDQDQAYAHAEPSRPDGGGGGVRGEPSSLSKLFKLS
ncbi:hypothetical protein F2Q69_00002458 [Brassica cretica]|uniref:Uncharacterized protein n=1 Tax=Brassica cretica TaxID=69181 RepID=A0A8S9NZ13_BRACR|nr:hypothetical protein F2Q69_00002458 [Brassica cretica]